jgi:hypothetical protein
MECRFGEYFLQTDDNRSVERVAAAALQSPARSAQDDVSRLLKGHQAARPPSLQARAAPARVRLSPAPALRSVLGGAQRTRQWRARRREGRVCFRIELSPLAIDGLVELRWLHPSRRDDPAAICEGFRRFLGFALDTSRNR